MRMSRPSLLCGPDGEDQTGDIEKFSFNVMLICLGHLLVVSLAFSALARPHLER